MAGKTIEQARKVLRHDHELSSVAVAPDGTTIVTGSHYGIVAAWNLASGEIWVMRSRHTGSVTGVNVTPDGETAISSAFDGTLKLWSLKTGTCLATLRGANTRNWGVAISGDGQILVAGCGATALGVWDFASRELLHQLEGHLDDVRGVAISDDNRIAVSGSFDASLKIWDLETGQCRVSLHGHGGEIDGVAIAPDARTIVSGSDDTTLKVWDSETGDCRATFEGHTQSITRVAITPDGKSVVSASRDETVKVWDLETGDCRATFVGHNRDVFDLALTPDGRSVISVSLDKTLQLWDLPTPDTLDEASETTRYANAKVVLVGESGVGKTGLALRLAEDRWRETESTHGMNVWPLELPGLADDGMEREVWLWDFAGQPDYRLIHQLYMDETALALLVIDPQRDDPFQPLEHWEKALGLAVKRDPAKVLVAARCDRGGFTISRKKIDHHCDARSYATHLDTSAKTGEGCAELKDLISRTIPWDRLPWTATSRLFKTLKDAILAIKEERTALIRLSELRQRLQLELPDEPIEEKAVRTVVGLLESQGIVKPLDFGGFVLLQTEQINNYASAVVRSARDNADEIGAVPERAVLEAEIDFKDMERLEEADEKILLRAMLQTFLDRSLCARVETDQGTQLVFPSYFKQDRPEAPEKPPVIVNYSFSGTLDEIYSTLVVRLHYTEPFEMDELWRYAADFKTQGGQRVGLHMLKQRDDRAEIEVYFDADVPVDTKVAFIKYIHEHLKRYAEDATRVRSYVCPHCDEPLENRRAIRIRLEKGLSDVLCTVCEGRVPLHDLIETKFASDEFLRTVQEMDATARINLDNESLELILVGHAFSTAGEAGHIFRPTPNSDWGIDGEIEFKVVRDDDGQQGARVAEASGQRVYLQLKSGDSYLRKRKGDGQEIFTIKKERQAKYWLAQPCPVMLVIRSSDGEIRWMNITDYLERHGTDTRQVVFDGEPFSAANIALLSDSLLGEESSS